MATARYVRITLVGTPYKNDVLAFRKVGGGTNTVIVDGTPVCAVKTGPGVWRVSTVPSADSAFAGGCHTSIGDPPEAAGEIGGLFRPVKSNNVKVANYRMPFSLTVTLDCALVTSSASAVAKSWCDIP